MFQVTKNGGTKFNVSECPFKRVVLEVSPEDGAHAKFTETWGGTWRGARK